LTTIRNQDHEIEELHKELNKYKNLLPEEEEKAVKAKPAKKTAKPAAKKPAVKKVASKK